MKRTLSILFTLALVLSFSLVATTPVSAAIINVPGDYGTIQAAIDDAVPGDTIIVAAGHIAEENLIITTDGLTLTTDASDPATIRYQVATTSSVVDIRGEGVILENFIIERNNGVSGTQAINVRRSGVIVQRTIVTGFGNTPGPHAIAAIHLTDGDPGPYGLDLEGVIIRDNDISGDFAYGVYVTTYAATSIEVTIEGNRLHDLSYDFSYWGTGTKPGWGVGVWDSNLITYGGSLYVTIVDNTFEVNGVYVWPKDPATEVLDVTVHCNDFLGAPKWGVYNVSGVAVDAAHNWWGDANGPGPVGPGMGYYVSDDVLFEPWAKTGPGVPAEVETSTETGTASFSAGQGCVVQLEALSEIPPAPPRGISFPHGVFSFRITCISPGDTVLVTVTLPSAVPVGTVWWKYDGTSWYSLPNLNDNGNNTMVIRLTDGGTGDSDSIPGQITDPGGPGNPLTVGWDGSPVSKAAVLIPIIGLLAAIGGVGMLVWRRRRAEG